jgi:CII-binding regulator of phage lambda lysogenization HflD
MKVIFGVQEVLEVVNNGMEALPANPTDAQRNAFREAKKKDCKALFYIHQCLDSKLFEKIADAESSKAAWDTLMKYYGGDPKVKKVGLQSLRRQYKLLEMEENETISNYFSRLVTLTNQMKNCGETLSDQTIVEKILKTLPSKFNHIVVTIEETKDLSELKVKDPQGTLEAHEMKKSEREMERTMIKHCLQNSRTMHKRKKSGRRVKSLKKVVQRMKTRLNHFPRTKERRISIRKM